MKKRSMLDDTDRATIALLAAEGKTANAIAKIVSRDPKSVRSQLAKPEMVERISEYQERLAEKFEKLTDKILDNVSEEDVRKASLQQKVISAATALDKMRLLRHQSTNNISILHRLIDESPDLPDL